MLYFDSAATSLLRPRAVRHAVDTSLRKYAGYGRSGHKAAVQAAEAVYACREEVAALFGLTAPERVIFCQNATHALNIALLGLPLKGSRIVISGYEHNAVRRPLVARCEREERTLSVAGSPLFDREGALRAFEHLLDAECALCVCTMVSNVFGNILPVAEIGAICRERGIPFVIDAAQAAGCMAVDCKILNADIVCMPGHKGLLGPTGTGIMLLCTDCLPQPLLFGGTGGDSANLHQPEYLPDRFESGTPNLPGINGLCAGVRYIRKYGSRIWRRETKLVSELKYALKNFPGVRLFDSEGETCGNLFSFAVDGMQSEAVAEKLAARGVAVRAGLHCAPLAHESAGTLADGTVRVSVCGENTEEEVTRFCRTLWAVLMRK